MPGLIAKLSRPKATRHRLTPKEEKERQQALRLKRIDRYLSTLERENPAEYSRLMAAEIEAEQRRRGIGGEEGEAIDPIQAAKGLLKELAELQSFLPPNEPRSEGAELVHGLVTAAGKVLENPVVGARIAALLPPPPQGETVIEHRPAQPSPEARETHQEPATAPPAPATDPNTPLARFLPLMVLDPRAAADRLIDEADDLKENGDGSLWETLTAVAGTPGPLLPGVIRVYGEVYPAYKPAVDKLLERIDWTRAVVAEVRRILEEEMEDEPPPPTPIVAPTPVPMPAKKAKR